MEFTIAMGLAGWALVIAGAVVIGIVAELIGEAHTGFEWVATGIGAFVGALALLVAIIREGRRHQR